MPLKFLLREVSLSEPIHAGNDSLQAAESVYQSQLRVPLSPQSLGAYFRGAGPLLNGMATEVGKPVTVTGVEVRGLLEPVMDGACDLLLAVDRWLATH